MINLEFSIDEVNQLLSLLGKLPFAEVNNTIMKIVELAEPQAKALAEQEQQ